MFSEAYTKLELEEVAEILDYVNAHIEGSLFDPLETTILAIDIPFYAGYRYLDIADHATKPPLRRSVIQKGSEYIILNWSYKPIYALNEKAPIILNENNVLEYIRFFFLHVKGRHGRFKVCESLEAIAWKDEPTLDVRKVINSHIKPLKIEEKDKSGVYKISGIMMLKGTFFSVTIYVEPTGRVTLTDHDIILEDIPVLDDVFLN